ncbi:PaaI family thioesterase [Nocardioides panacisoli]|uniref:PaaI family thioesterase n=1 Tax=Nocardioides panacisoli TaxID=627624 RepID=UPI001C62A0E7|nr:PaaI family thioesterase [Nocardioides panacisoli]QYJ03542.1 PaaI family thioesterase [Nocardioides panacisoli]
MSELTIEDAHHALEAQPFSVLLGTRITRFDHLGTTLELDIRPDLLQQNGYVHGGVQCYLADNALTFAGGYALGPMVLTSGVNLTYLRPATGETLIAHATVLDKTSSTAAAQVEILVLHEDSEYRSALGTGTISAIRPQDPPTVPLAQSCGC